MPRTLPLSPSDRQALAGVVPLLAVCIALAEYLLDHTEPRWMSPWFWMGLIVTVALLVLVQVLRFTKSTSSAPAKPDYSAGAIMRRRLNGEKGDL